MAQGEVLANEVVGSIPSIWCVYIYTYTYIPYVHIYIYICIPVYMWAFKGLPCDGIGAQACNMVILGPFWIYQDGTRHVRGSTINSVF